MKKLESNKNRGIQKDIEDLLTTKKNAYLLFCDLVDDLTATQKETLSTEFKRPFEELYFEYIRPIGKEDYDNLL